jgi:hypothetical protein
MLAIRVGDTYLDLPDKLSVSFTIVDPIFDKERISRTFSYPFKIKATPRNMRALGFVNRLDSTFATKKIKNVVLFLEQQVFEVGVLRVVDITALEVELAFQSDSIDLVEQLKKISLQDLSFPHDAKALYRPDVRIKFEGYDIGIFPPLVIAINGQIYTRFSNERTDLVSDINTDYPGMVTIVDNQADFMTVEFSTTAYPDLLLTLKPDWPQADDFAVVIYGIVIEDDTAAAQSYMNTTLQYFSDIASAVDPDHAFPTLYMPNLYGDSNTAFKYLVNPYDSDNGSFYENELQAGETWQYTMIPMAFLVKVLDKIIQRIGMVLGGDFPEDTDVKKLLVYNNKTIDKLIDPAQFVEDDPDGALSFATNAFLGVYDLADHLPDVTAWEFLEALQATFPLLFITEGGSFRLEPIRNYLSRPAVDWTNKTEPFYRLTLPEYDAYTIDYDRQDEIVIEPEQLLKLISDEEAIEPLNIKLPFFSLYKKRIAYAFSVLGQPVVNVFYDVPTTTDEGSSTPANISSDIPLKLLWYHGLQSDAAGADYPYASYDNYNFDQERIGEYSFEIAGEDGMYEKWWKGYINILVGGKPVNRRVRLNMSDILNIRRKPGYRMYIYGENGAMSGIVKEIRFSATPKRMSISSVEIVKI